MERKDTYNMSSRASGAGRVLPSQILETNYLSERRGGGSHTTMFKFDGLF